MADQDLIKPLAEQLPRLKPADQETLTREYLAKKLPQWGQLKNSEREGLVSQVIGKYGAAPTPQDASEPPNWQGPVSDDIQPPAPSSPDKAPSRFDRLSPAAAEARRRQVEGKAPELADAPIANAVISGAFTGGAGALRGLPAGLSSAVKGGIDFGLQTGLQDWVEKRLLPQMARHPYLKQALAIAGATALTHGARPPEAEPVIRPEYLEKLAQRRALSEPIELSEGSAVPVFEAPKGEPRRLPAPAAPAPIELRDPIEPQSEPPRGPIAAPQTPAETVLGMAAGQTPAQAAPAPSRPALRVVPRREPIPLTEEAPERPRPLTPAEMVQQLLMQQPEPAAPAGPAPALPAGLSAAPQPASGPVGPSTSAVGVPRPAPAPEPPATRPATASRLPVGYSFRGQPASAAAARAPEIVPHVPGQPQLMPAPQPQEEIRAAHASGDQEALQTALFRELDRHPSATVYDMRNGDMKTDPDRFQYKTMTNRTTGADAALNDIKKYKESLGGIITVYHDQDGGFYVDNGHGRHAAQARLMGPDATHRVQIIESRQKGEPGAVPGAIEYGLTPEQARTYGGVINIAEGRGTALDAARLFRQQGMNTPEQIEEQGIAVNPTEEKTMRAVGLSQLSPMLFRAVDVGQVSERLGVIIGRELPGDPDTQNAVYQMLKKRRGNIEKISATKLDDVINLAKNAPKVTQKTKDLFGEHEYKKSLIDEQADVIGGVRSRLMREKRLFGGTAEAAQQLEQAGVAQVDVDTGERLSKEAVHNLRIFRSVVYVKGPVNAIIRDAARQIAENPKQKNAIIAGVYKQITDELSKVIPEAPAENTQQGGLFGAAPKTATLRSRPPDQP